MYPGKWVYVYFILYMALGKCNNEFYFDFKEFTGFFHKFIVFWYNPKKSKMIQQNYNSDSKMYGLENYPIADFFPEDCLFFYKNKSLLSNCLGFFGGFFLHK